MDIELPGRMEDLDLEQGWADRLAGVFGGARHDGRREEDVDLARVGAHWRGAARRPGTGGHACRVSGAARPDRERDGGWSGRRPSPESRPTRGQTHWSSQMTWLKSTKGGDVSCIRVGARVSWRKCQIRGCMKMHGIPCRGMGSTREVTTKCSVREMETRHSWGRRLWGRGDEGRLNVRVSPSCNVACCNICP